MIPLVMRAQLGRVISLVRKAQQEQEAHRLCFCSHSGDRESELKLGQVHKSHPAPGVLPSARLPLKGSTIASNITINWDTSVPTPEPWRTLFLPAAVALHTAELFTVYLN